MIRNPKLHVIAPDGETVFRSPVDNAGVVPRKGDLIIPPGEEEEFRVSTIEHVYSSSAGVDEDEDEKPDEYDHDIYVETEDPSDA